MKKTFLKIGLLLAFGLTIVVFNSCEKDNDNGGVNVETITATDVINSSSQIVTVKVNLVYRKTETDNYFDFYPIAETQYKNNGFTLKLPATIDDKYLAPFYDEDVSEITVSDKTVKIVIVSHWVLKAYDVDDNEIGCFGYWSKIPSFEDENCTETVRYYVDKNVTINGQTKYVYENEGCVTENINNFNNLTLKKGWNICYINDTYTSNQSTKTYTRTFSNQKPSEVTLKWYFK